MVARDLSRRDEFEAFLKRPENRDKRFELINGEIVEKVPTQLHSLIAHLLSGYLFLYFRERPIGRVHIEIRIALPDDDLNDRIPDLAVVLKAGRELDPNAPLAYMPDLAIEIQSPDQSDKFMIDKANYYLSHGTRMVWIVYPNKRLIEVLTAEDRKLLTDADTLDGGNLLPDFKLPLSELFSEQNLS